MKSFKAEIPSRPSKAVAPLRVEDAEVLWETMADIEGPLHDDLAAELIALAFVHRDSDVRKRATGLLREHLADLGAFKAAYGAMAGAANHVVNKRLRAFDHPLRAKIASAMLFHRRAGVGIVFEEDRALRRDLLAIMTQNAQREGELELRVSEVYWHWSRGHGSASWLDLHTLPPSLFAELARLRRDHPFEALSFHAASLTSLPDELARTRRWLKGLCLSFNPLEELPAVVLRCTNLEELRLAGTQLRDIPEDIAALQKLRKLDLGNGRKMTSIPASVCALDTVEELRIGNGSIRTIPAAIAGMKSLRVLEMRSTRVRKLPASLGELPNLKVINMQLCDGLTKAQVKAVVGKGVRVND